MINKNIPSNNAEQTKFDNLIDVINTTGQSQHTTYLRRANGLVKNGRAQWVDEKTIRLLEPSNGHDQLVDAFKYHCQHQARSFARAILSVPAEYPLQANLPRDFSQCFSKLCELAKDIYMDMSKQPEAYGIALVDIASQDYNLAREGYRTLHRFVDTLSNLSCCSKLQEHQLIVNTDAYKSANKKGTGSVSGPVPKYELLLSRLVDFGFEISGFAGKPFGKNVESFVVSFPDFPQMIDTIKAYCKCWDLLKTDRTDVKIWANEFHHHYYRFDYKITADRNALSIEQWIGDEADYWGYSPQLKRFSLAFYAHSLQYKDVLFNGDYSYKSKRIARMYQGGYIALGMTEQLLHIRLKEMDKYMPQIDAMPESIQELMMADSCRHCGFQGATSDHCRFRVHWTFHSEPHIGCAHACFYFNNFDVTLIPDYWKLLELEYGLKKA